LAVSGAGGVAANQPCHQAMVVILSEAKDLSSENRFDDFQTTAGFFRFAQDDRLPLHY